MESSGGNLLTTVSKLPLNFQVQYIKVKAESPLDLTVKQANKMLISPLKKRYRDVEILSPLKKRYREDEHEHAIKSELTPPLTPSSDDKREQTPKKTVKSTSINQKSAKVPQTRPKSEKKSKAMRKLKFDEDKSSPVSGTIIRTLEEIDENVLESGDIDPEYNVVEVTEEAKMELAAIQNVIGAYQCKLCKIEFEDAFCLARHRCACIVLLEYRCPECSKKFSCPANLSSHRRWHFKPKDQVNKKPEPSDSFLCTACNKSFKRLAYLKKHQATHDLEKKEKGKKSSVLPAQPSNLYNSTDEILIPKTVLSFSQISPHSNSDTNHSTTENDSNSSHPLAAAKFKILGNNFTEDENIAISALANLFGGHKSKFVSVMD